LCVIAKNFLIYTFMKKQLILFAAFLGSLLIAPASYAQYVTESVNDSTIVVEAEPELYVAEKNSNKKKRNDLRFLNHFSVGVKAGLDGVAAEACIPLGRHIQVRGGYSMQPDKISPLAPYVVYNTNLNLGSYEIGGTKRDLSNVPVSAWLVQNNARGLVDLYLSKNGPLHLTAGVYIGSPVIAAGQADLSGALQPEEYNSVYVELDGQRIYTDSNGMVPVEIRANRTNLRPYFGLGLGRSAIKSGIAFSLDFGVVVTEGETVVVTNDTRDDVVLTSAMIDHRDVIDTTIPGLNKPVYIEDALDYFREEFRFFPVVNLGLHIRLF